MTDFLGPARRRAAAIVVGAILGIGLYLVASAAVDRLGLPLDDAWIHQTYARNLAATGTWAFIPGEASGGSTSPLWTLILAGGHLLGFDPRIWAYALGTTALILTGLAASMWLESQTGLRGGWIALAAVAIVLDWHLLWSAVSGMEVILLVGLVVGVMLVAARPVFRPEVVGLLVGVGVWVRPDAITLLAIPGIVLLLAGSDRPRARAAKLARLLVGASLPLIAYLLFNLSTAGTIWPSTFYSKQTEYAVLRAEPYLGRFWRLAWQPLIGAGFLLLPAVLFGAARVIRQREWGRLAPLAWALGYLAIYAARLPVTYQHGRYQIPVVPVVLLLGWEGLSRALEGAPSPRRRLWIRAWAAASVATTIGFVALGARAYATDVAIIETEMVETAHWIARQTEPDALVAAHDIGALGYFGGRDVLDLAGLTDPEVIPIVRDEAALAALLSEAGADYLMTFPGWYPALVACAQPVHQSQGPFSRQAGEENMVVYRWSALAPKGCMLYSP